MSATHYTLRIGVHSAQGRRPANEDTEYINTEFSIPGYTNSAMIAVFDGHAGDLVSKELKTVLPAKLQEALVKGDEQTCLTKIFLDTDQYLLKKSLSEGSWADGSTAVTAFILDRKLFVANVGDSEAILVKKGEAINLTTVHKPDDPEENKRINELGGKVFYGRVFGMLAVSRAFGDIQFKPPKTPAHYVCAEPAISYTDIDETCEYLVLACDGLWDVYTHKEVAQFVDYHVSQGKQLSEVATMLIDSAIEERESTDNVTVIIVQFVWGEEANADQRIDVTFGNTHKRPNIQRDFQKNNTVVLPSMLPVSAPLYLKSIAGVKINRSYAYLSEEHHYFCTSKLGTQFPLPCWVSQEFISKKLFGEAGIRALKLTENHHQRFFLWATQFSNVHTTFQYNEKSITIDGCTYSGPEQYFQGQKSVGTPDELKAQLLLKNANPDQAYSIGRHCAMRSDWETVKDNVMYKALEAKFTQHKALKQLLLETDGYLLVQLKPNDSYWGTGPDGRGKNKHAEILMQVRDELKK